MENEVNVMNVAEEAIENNAPEIGFNSKSFIGISAAVLCVGAVVAGAVIASRKLKGRIDAAKTKRAIDKLEKQGYTVIGSEPIFGDEEVEVNPEQE